MEYQVKLRHYFSYVVDPVARALLRMGLTPNTLTLLGFCVNLITGVTLARSKLTTGGLLILAAGSFDMLDGAAARQSNRKAPSGALLDSVIDRYSEAAIFLGLAVHFYATHNLMGLSMTFAAMAGSFFVSYVRARAESLDLECKVGLMQRTERLVLLSAGLIFQGALAYFGILPNELLITAVISLLALLAHMTAIHRLVFSFKALNRLDRI
jgi:CDP-diacylglycerol--glycerol-3-phosphate 3-phosphatidyltransferase